MITFEEKGDYEKTLKSLKKMSNGSYLNVLDEFGKRGVDALSSNTPLDSGKTATSWGYVIEKTGRGFMISWTNSNFNDGVSIAILIQYGHGTRNGGYVVGRDFINPAIRPIADDLVNKVWKEVISNA